MSNTNGHEDFTEQSARAALTRFLEVKTEQRWEPTTDLFQSGAVSSIFAMELVVHVEQTFDVVIEGDELNMENFRTIDAMVAMVSRLRSVAPHG